MAHYSNPTENSAIGAVDRELRRMQKWAAQIRQRRLNNTLTPQELARARKAFVGIYRRFLLEALADEGKAAPRHRGAASHPHGRNAVSPKKPE